VDIVKYSGATETFVIDQLRAFVKRAGASEGYAQRVARNVEIRVRNAGATPTEQIREWVIIELMMIPDYNSAEQYSAYRRH
jgi:hypothetical protein